MSDYRYYFGQWELTVTRFSDTYIDIEFVGNDRSFTMQIQNKDFKILADVLQSISRNSIPPAQFGKRVEE